MLILSLLFATVAAVTSPMQPLDFLTGEWDGTGWIIAGPNGRQTFSQHESVRSAAGGSLIVIDGLGVGTSEATAGKTVHQAFAVVSFDGEAKTFRWRAWRAGGTEIATTAEVGDRKIVWGFQDPRAGTIRFTIRVEAGEWHEVGEVSRDGTTWMQFFEMKLKKHHVS